MDRYTLISSLILGAGGSEPGVQILPSNGTEAFGLAELPHGHSVYAIDVDAESGLISLGTRGGRIELLSWLDDGESFQIQRTHSLLHGAPVLLVCLLGGSQLATTDTAGRCLLWQPALDPNSPQSLEANGGCICSLLRLPNNKLLGLSAEGRLLLWDIGNGGRLLSTMDAPVPPEILALVRLLYWPAQHAAVYPAGDGRLVTYNLTEMQVRTCSAHEGGFYAILTEGDKLHTIGKSDGLLKSWQDMDGSSSQQLEAPQGIISGHILVGNSPRALLIGEAGEAGVYSLDSDPIRLIGQLSGNQHRAVGGPSVQACRGFQQRQRLSIAKQLRSQIKTHIDRREFEETKDLYRQLAELGFKMVSLALRARQARAQQDILGELEHRHELANSLPADDHRSLASLRHYTDVLQRAWRLAEAKDVYDRIDIVKTNAPKPEWLAKAAEVLEGEGWVIEPDVEMPVLIESATLTGRPFVGLWTYEVTEPVTFPEGNLTAEGLATKYEQVKAENNLPDLHKAKAHRFWWISRGAVRQAEVVTFESPLQQDCMGSRPAVRILSGEIQNGFVPMSLFDAGGPQPEESFQDHNHKVTCAYEWISQRELVDPWPRKVRQVLSLALRRLHTEALSHPANERIQHVTVS